MGCPAGVALCMAYHRLPWHPLAASLAPEHGASSDGGDWRPAQKRENHISSLFIAYLLQIWSEFYRLSFTTLYIYQWL